ncbi:M20 metallopeptidase family protein [Clostridium cellulovorans]|uniref:Amidohydrolase n=1 Tax=Clostridium cellulovorans (strain ATCC 35296 / DSM 3052 / OCM 3 / 743B) TaxID=573061 RepID=D9SV35_CLOC7|nr:M20 family metallopeptidase [Clostridium cellulovorans]ADL53009.1 amidohydrolase [Clostridium cellulovorans 743B]
MNSLIKDAEALQAELVKHRRFLHQNPEIGFDLTITSEYVFKTLEAMGCKPERIVGSGIRVLIGKGTVDKTILIRADMDALNIEEEAEVQFKSKNGNMHACGHDFHTTMLLGAAKLLKQREAEIEGYVKLMFQPAEETIYGATSMIEAGILENPTVDAAMMIHVSVGSPIAKGTVLVAEPGASMAGSDWFKVTIKGEGAHGAMPQTGVDPLNVMVHVYLGLQEIISREIDNLDNTVLTVGTMQGGTVNNVIPDKAELRGSLRTFSKNNRDFIIKRIREVAEGIAKAYRAEAIVEMSNYTPALMNDAKNVAVAREFLSKYFGVDSFIPMGELTPGGKNMISEDFAFISQEVPSVQLFLCAGNSEEGYIYPIHHPKAIFDETVLSKGAAVYAGYAIEWLKKNI